MNKNFKRFLKRMAGMLLGALILAGGVKLNMSTVKASIELNFEGASEVSIGEKIKGAIVDAGQQDYYCFTTEEVKKANSWFQFQCMCSNKTTSTAGPIMYLYDEDYQKIVEVGCTVNEFNDEIVKLNPGTTYYILVTTTYSTADYTFQITEYQDEGGETMEEAIEISANETYKNESQVPQDTDWFLIHVTSSKQIFTLKNTSINFPLYYYIFDEDGIRKEAGSVNKGKSDVKTFSLEQGTYYIKIDPDYSTWNSAGKYVLSVATEQVASNMTISAISMSKGDSITLTPVFELSSKISASWTSNKKSVATISASGKLVAKSRGNAVITCKSKTSGAKMSFKVVVK